MIACGEKKDPASNYSTSNSCSGFVAPAIPASAKKVNLLIVRIQFKGAPFENNGFIGDPFAYNYFQSNECIWANKIFGTNPGELNHYYQETSQSKFQLLPATETYGEVNDGVVTVTVEGNHPNPGSSGAFHQILKESLQLADPYVDFSSFDSSADGDLNRDDLQIMFLVAGYESASGGTPGVWAHAYCLDTVVTGEKISPPKLDGTTLMACPSSDGSKGNGYSRFGERYVDGSDMTIGVIAHELGHATSMELPDLYDITGQTAGIGKFALMGAGSWTRKNSDEIPGATPIPMSAWSKIKIGWMTPTDVTISTLDVSLDANDQSNRNILKIPTLDSKEYFLMENLGITGYNEGYYSLESKTFEGGVAIWHIDEGQTDCKVYPQLGIGIECNGWLTNADGNHKAVDLEEALLPGLDNSEHYGKRENLFYSGNATDFNAGTTPNSKDNSGDATGIDIMIKSIAEPSMLVDVQK